MAQQPPGELCWVPDWDRTRTRGLMEAGLKTGGSIRIRTLGTGEEDGQGWERPEAGVSSGSAAGENVDVEPACFFTSFTVN